MQLPQGCRIGNIANSDVEAIWLSNMHCEAMISLHGAQPLQFYQKSKQRHVLWLSEQAQYQIGKAIRGGIPLCFPWFGGHPTDATRPAHGFARNQNWQLKQVTADELGHHLLFELRDSDLTRQFWDYAFSLHMQIHCGETLQLEFKLDNLDQRGFEFTFAWHSYFALPAQTTQVQGLQGLTYIDQLDGNQQKIQETELLSFHAEVDRIYSQTQGRFTLLSQGDEAIQVQSSARSAVVWNPWIAKAKRLADVADTAWQDFICVETGQIGAEAQYLAAGAACHYQLNIA